MKRTTMILVGCISIGIGGNTLLAQNGPTNPRPATEAGNDKPGQDQDSARAMRHDYGHLAHASQLMDMTVRDTQGKHIGSVEDMVIDSQGRVAFVILSFEDAFVDDDQFYAVPPKALHRGSDPDRQDLILDASVDTFTANSGFSEDRFPMFNEELIRDTYERFGQEPYWEGDMQGRNVDQGDRNERRSQPARGPRNEDADNQEDERDNANANESREARESRDGGDAADGRVSNDERQRTFNEAPAFDRQNTWTCRGTEIIGKQVVNESNEELGRIKDLVFDVTQCRVLYVVLTDGGVLNLGETFTPVPYSALTSTADEDKFELDATKDSFEAISFQESAWPDMSNRQWAQRIHTQFDQDSYWAMQNDNDAQGRSGDRSWRQGSDYNNRYDQQKRKTITGTVTSISEFTPEDGAAKGRQLMVRDEDGHTSTVHLGPTAYMQLQDSTFTIEQGDEVTITGSACKFNDMDVLMANQIRNEDGESLELRDRSGNPKWDNQDRENRAEEQNQPNP